MRHVVSTDDFKRTVGLMKSPEEVDVWWVCDEYEIRSGRIVAKHAATSFGDGKHYPPAFNPELDRGWRSYRPLEDRPDLFLRFAKLYTERNFDKAALAWSHVYGLPGADRHKYQPDGMSLRRFREEAKRAWAVLTMYEAALNRDVRAIESLLAEHRKEAVDFWPLEINEEKPFGPFENELQFALFGAMSLVEWTVDDLCDRWLIVEGDKNLPDPSRVKRIHGFSNLLGAMYWQMYWLLASGGDVKRCEYCGRVISLARLHPERRKPPKHKRFCDAACRQANHRSRNKD